MGHYFIENLQVVGIHGDPHFHYYLIQPHLTVGFELARGLHSARNEDF